MAEKLSAKSAWKLNSALKKSATTKPTKVGTARVTRRDSDGSVWVRLPGSNVDTPVNGQILSDAQVGDTVSVRIENGRLSLMGNASTPSVGQQQVNTTVQPVRQTADNALETASTAQTAAELATSYAASAQADADRAKDAADLADGKAQAASASAATAASAAQSALLGLSTVQDVVDVMAWLSAHSVATQDTSVIAGKDYYLRDATTGTMTRVEEGVNPTTMGWFEATPSTDTEAVEGKVYHELDSTTGVLTPVETIPAGADPSALGWYEVSESTDTRMTGGKSYYTVTVATGVATPISPSSLGWWEMDDAVTQYLAAHLAMTDYGLNLKVDSESGYIHIGTLDGSHPYGTYIVGAGNEVTSLFAENESRIGSEYGAHVRTTPNGMYVTSANGVDYFSATGMQYAGTYTTSVEAGPFEVSMTSVPWRMSAAEGPIADPSSVSASLVCGYVLHDRDTGESLDDDGFDTFSYTPATMPGSSVDRGLGDGAVNFTMHDGGGDGFVINGHRYAVSLKVDLSSVITGTPEVTIGKPHVVGANDNESNVIIDYHGLRLVDKEGRTYFHVSDLRGPDGTFAATDTFTGNGSTSGFNLTYFAASTNYTVTVSDGSGGTVTKALYAVLFSTPPTNGATITVEYETKSSAAKAYTLGIRGRTGNVGAMSFVTGNECVASGQYSHAKGTNTTASGFCSHAEGGNTTASGSSSHAEGSRTTASGGSSHAEGGSTTASGATSHAQNLGTIAASASQTALGKYNEEDTNGDYALIIGNGTADDARSNALTVDWLGNVWAAGKATLTDAIEAASAAISGLISAAKLTITKDAVDTGTDAIVVSDGTDDVLAVGWDGTTDLGPMELSDSASGVHVHGSNVSTTDETASSGLYGLLVGGFDSGDNLRSYLKHVDLTNGNQGLQLETRRNFNGTNVYHGVQLHIDASKNRTVTVSDQGAWRSGLGLGSLATKNSVATTDLPTVPTTKGGTGVTAKQASTVSLNNSAASTNHAWHNGILATVTLGALHVTSALSSGSSRNVGTVPAGYRPSDTVWVTGGTNADASTGKVFIAIASSGAITLYNRSGSSLGTGVNMYFTATYAI